MASSKIKEVRFYHTWEWSAGCTCSPVLMFTLRLNVK